MVGGVAAWYAVACGLGGQSPDDLLDMGVMLGPLPLPAGPAAGNALPLGIPTPLWFDPNRLAAVDWDFVANSVPELFTITALAVTGMLLNVSGIELACGRDANVSYEMQANGLTNLVSAVTGSLVHYPGLASTKLAAETVNAGGDGGAADAPLTFPTPGVVVGVLNLLLLALHPAAINFLPRAVVGGILLSLGLSFFFEWAIDGATRLPRPEYGVVMVILVAIALFGYLPGVAVGVVSALVVFVADYSRISIVRIAFELGGSNPLFSSRTRSKFQRAAIQANGRGAYGLVLSGFIFFATAYKLLEQIKSQHAERLANGEEGLRWLVLDFRYVVGVDGSAITCFNKIRNFAMENDITLVLTDVDGSVGLERVVGVIVSGEDLTPGLREIAVSEKQAEEERWEVALRLAKSVLGEEGKADRPRAVVEVLSDLDAGLQFVEEAILEERVPKYMKTMGALEPSRLTLSAVVEAVTTNDEEKREFLNCWEQVRFVEGDQVCRRGELADKIYFVEDAVLQAYWGPGVTVEITGNFLGATGFYSSSGFGAVRFADVVVTRGGEGYRISADAVRALERESPALSARFTKVMASHLADTIISRNKVLAQYQDLDQSELDRPSGEPDAAS